MSGWGQSSGPGGFLRLLGWADGTGRSPPPRPILPAPCVRPGLPEAMVSRKGSGGAVNYASGLEDTEGVNRERAEIHLRLVAEVELRRATTPPRTTL